MDKQDTRKAEGGYWRLRDHAFRITLSMREVSAGCQSSVEAIDMGIAPISIIEESN
ncbi:MULTISPECIES: hypothetical protein [Nitrosospira]|uniref:hypothetical protein n=1 Tax=Nitrosospira TaxID=35798 RepID=UPI0015A0E74F|nr:MULTISPECIES: hypothetical protein [Nitrosospira]